MTIGERIRDRRIELGMSAEQLADKIGKNRTTIYRYESSEIESMSIEVLQPLASALRTTPAFLMGWEEESNDVEIIAEELQKDENLRMLFSLAKDAKPEDLQLCADMLKRFKEQR